MKKQEGIFGSIRMNKQKYVDEFLGDESNDAISVPSC